MFPGVNPLYSTTKYIYSTFFFISITNYVRGFPIFNLFMVLWCSNIVIKEAMLLHHSTINKLKMGNPLTCPMYLMPLAYRVSAAVACIADVADHPAFAGFPTGDVFPTVSGVPTAAVVSAIILYLYPIADVPSVVFLSLGCCWLSYF
jgi:hypothetical protein